MAPQPQRQPSPRSAAATVSGAEQPSRHLKAAGAPAPAAPRPQPHLRVARAPAASRRSIGGLGTLAAVGLFVVCLALAALHAVLVENQASLDDLIEHNQLRFERIDQLQAEIAYLDSPEGLAEQAQAAGLVPAADLAVLTPIGPDRLPPPGVDPFDLASSGWTPPLPVVAASTPPELAEPTG